MIEYWTKEGKFETTEEFFKLGFQYTDLHRSKGPAHSYWHNNRKKAYEEWRRNGIIHRTNGPAVRVWYENGQTSIEQWRVNAKLHRLDGPAGLRWFEKGEKYIEQWRVNAKLHRLDGPANLIWSEKGEKYIEQWWINDIDVTEQILPWFKQEGIDPYNLTDEDKFQITMRWA